MRVCEFIPLVGMMNMVTGNMEQKHLFLRDWCIGKDAAGRWRLKLPNSPSQTVCASKVKADDLKKITIDQVFRVGQTAWRCKDGEWVEELAEV